MGLVGVHGSVVGSAATGAASQGERSETPAAGTIGLIGAVSPAGEAERVGSKPL